jgi:ADP-ribose pyrophosphatase YjhB (NUDIX family)
VSWCSNTKLDRSNPFQEPRGRHRDIAKEKKLLPKKLWMSVLTSVPIACVDIIVHRKIKGKTCALLGYRKIYPYENRWALPGGRIIKNESLRDSANPQLAEIGLQPTGKYRLVGVYPVDFKRRSDISICLSTHMPSKQEPRPTKELVRYVWQPFHDLPSTLGSNYRRMLRDFKAGRYGVR